MSMEFSKEAIHRRCVEALSQVGLPAVVCEYYADAAQCEYDVTSAIYRMHNELQQAKLQPRDVATVVNITRVMSQNFSAWKKTLDDLISRRSTVPSLNLDQRKINDIQTIKALCTLQTKEMQLTEGDDVVITDASQPNRLKVRNDRGEEGYVPTLSCFLPSPDRGSLDVVDRLQLYLLMCWADCDKRLKSCLNSSLVLSTNDLCTFWSNRPAASDKWEDRISRRLQRITDALNKEINSGLEYGRLHKTLSSLENELLSRKDAGLEPMITTIVNVDKAVLTYQAFKKQWRLFRQEVKDSSVRPMQLVLQWDPRILADGDRKCRYYEVKLTSQKTTVKEETVQVDSEDDQRRKGVEEIRTDVVTSDWDSFRTKDVRDRSGKEWTQRVRDEPDSVVRQDETEERSFVRTDVITTTETSSSESFRKKNVREEPGQQWSQRIRDESDSSAFQKYRTAGGGHSSTTEESWTLRSGRLTQGDTSSTLRVHEGGARALSPSPLHGGMRCQTVDSAQLDVSSHEEKRRFYISAVIDPRNGFPVSVREAVSQGIIDRRAGEYVNPRTGEGVAIETAMGDGRIVVDHVTTTRTPEKCLSIGIMTIRTETVTHEYEITAAMDTRSGQLLSADEARQRGILNEAAGRFVSTVTGKQMSLDDAVDAGLVRVQFEEVAVQPGSEPAYETTTYAIGFVVDQLLRRPVPFTEAVRRGLVDRDTGCYINNVTEERVFAGDAIRRGLYKGEVIDDPTSFIGVDSSNRVVVERIDRVRKNVIREVAPCRKGT